MKIGLKINNSLRRIIESFPYNTEASYPTNRFQNLVRYDGEKTPYELGTPQDIWLDYYNLRIRAWELFIKTDFVQNAIRKYCLWIVGSGLKMQSEPIISVLKQNGIIFSEGKIKELSQLLESSFRLYAESNNSSYSGNISECLHDQAVEALKNAIISGDVLIIQRTEKGRVTTQVIDGHRVRTPLSDNHISNAKKLGNKIIKGVELDKKGRHVAFHVSTSVFKSERIVARSSKTGITQAWLMYGLKAKISDVRGMSLLTAVMESSSKLDRFKEATIGAAEENAKVAYTIEHDSNSTGENPLAKSATQSMLKGKGKAPETASYQEQCDNAATNVAQTTNKQAWNMPVGAKLEKHESGSDPNFADYWQPNIDIIYATLGIPPEVAADKFEGSYSGSRAALKSWEYKMFVDRIIVLKRQYYQPVYVYWFNDQVLNDIIFAPGYATAVVKDNFMVKEAYTNARFIGSGVPHIDPLKEVKAEREKLGPEMANVPLSSAEQSMEVLNTGDFEANIKKSSNEKDIFEENFKPSIDE